MKKVVNLVNVDTYMSITILSGVLYNLLIFLVKQLTIYMAAVLIYLLPISGVGSANTLNLNEKNGEIYIGELNQDITSGGVTTGLALFAYNKKSQTLAAIHLPYREASTENTKNFLERAIGALGLEQTFFYIFGLSELTMPNEELKAWLGKFMQLELGVDYFHIQIHWLQTSAIGSLTFHKKKIRYYSG